MKTKLCVISILFIALSAHSFAQSSVQPQQKIKKISVSGSAEMEVDPDEIYVNFDLKEYYNKQKTKVGIDVIKKEFLESCAKAGIAKEDIHVQSMSGSAYNYWFIRKNKQEPDFLASVNYIVKFNAPDKLNDLVTKLNDEATNNMYISKISHSKMEDFRRQVKINATIAAKQKAQYLAESIGEKIGSALLIEETDGSPAPVMYNRMMMANKAGGGTDEGTDNTPFQKLTIHSDIHAEFELQ